MILLIACGVSCVISASRACDAPVPRQSESPIGPGLYYGPLSPERLMPRRSVISRLLRICAGTGRRRLFPMPGPAAGPCRAAAREALCRPDPQPKLRQPGSASLPGQSTPYGVRLVPDRAAVRRAAPASPAMQHTQSA